VRYVTKIASVLTVAAAVLMGAGFTTLVQSQSAEAQQAAPAAGTIVIGVVDAQVLATQSTAGKALMAAYAQRSKQLSDDVKKREDAWVKQAQLLDQQKGTLTPQDYQAKAADLNKQRDQIRADIDNKSRALDLQRQQAGEQLQSQSLTIIKGIIAQKGITILLNRGAVAWANTSVIDITPDVMTQLNQKLPSVKF